MYYGASFQKGTGSAMDWKLFRELRLLLTQLQSPRFWAVWVLFIVIAIQFL